MTTTNVEDIASVGPTQNTRAEKVAKHLNINGFFEGQLLGSIPLQVKSFVNLENKNHTNKSKPITGLETVSVLGSKAKKNTPKFKRAY